MNKFIKITNEKFPEMDFKDETKISDLDVKLKEEIRKGKLCGGEQAFRDDYPWYRLNIGYTNPLNFGEVHAELELIKNNIRTGERNVFYKYLKNRHQIFYGIGVGDTEIAFVDWCLKTEKMKFLLRA